MGDIFTLAPIRRGHLTSDCLLVASLTLFTFFFIYAIPEDPEELYYNSKQREQKSNDTIYDYSIKEWRKFRNYEIGIIHELMKRVLGSNKCSGNISQIYEHEEILKLKFYLVLK